MTPSLRKQRLRRKKTLIQRFAERKARRAALTLLKENKKVSKVVEKSGVTRTTARRIKSAMEAKDDAYLARLLTPTENHAGHPPLLTPDKEVNLVVRIKFAAAHGFSVDRLELKTMASKYVRKKRAMSEDWLPSNEWAVSFRSRNKDIS